MLGEAARQMVEVASCQSARETCLLPLMLVATVAHLLADMAHRKRCDARTGNYELPPHANVHHSRQRGCMIGIECSTQVLADARQR